MRPVKLASPDEYREHYRGMLSQIADKCAGLLLDCRAATRLRLSALWRENPRILEQQLEFLRHTLESEIFRGVVDEVLRNPHRRLEDEREDRDISRPFKPGRDFARQLAVAARRVKVPDTHPLHGIISSLPARISVPTRRDFLDTAENRFAKMVLVEFRDFLADVAAHLARQLAEDDKPATQRFMSEVTRLRAMLETQLSRGFFPDVLPPTVLPLDSPVLQRKAGYREVLRWWLRFRTAAELSWTGAEDMFHAGQRNVAELYEYWLFFQLLDWFCERFNGGGKPPLESLVDGLDGDSPNLRVRKRVPLGPFNGVFADPRRRLHAAFAYNRQFDVTDERAMSGSWTRKMHPDYTLTFWPAIDGMTAAEAAKLAEEQELLVHIHLDAKYRVENLDALFGDKASEDVDEEDAKSPGNYKRQDLLKMHAYRDAIKRSEGAYVLYPGDDKCRAAQFDSAKDGAPRWPHTMWGFHEILPGLGAFAIAPDESGDAAGLDHLAKFLEEVLMNLCNRASLRERRASDLYEALRQRQSLYKAGDSRDTGGLMLQDAPELDADKFRASTAADIMVLVGWFDSPEEKKWMLENGKVVLRLGDRRGSLPMVKSLAVASHILLHGREYETVSGLLTIAPKAGEVWTRTEILAKGFPTDASKPADDIFAVFSVKPDAAFADKKWDGKELEKAVVRFLNRQRPTYKKQLTELKRERTKPQLVSLADLEVALAAPV